MSWEEFEERRKASREPSETPAHNSEWLRLTAAVFSTRQGREWLEKAHKVYVDRASHPEASEALLRAREAQRRLILDIEIMVRSGLELARKETTT